MADTFKIEKTKVIAVDPSGAVRQLLSEVFRAHGFDNMQSMASVKDVMNTLEIEKVDFIVTPLLLDQNPNGLQLLKLISETPELKKTRIAFLLEEAELEYLPLAFSLGLLAWFPKPYNKDTLTQELVQFKDQFKQNAWDSTRQAAHYCMANLASHKRLQNQVDLARSLLDLYPGQAEYLLGMAKPLAQLNRKEDAQSALRQVKILRTDFAAKVDELAIELFGESGLSSGSGSGEDILRLGTCAIVDHDQQSSEQIKGILTEIGVKEIIEFHDGNAAWIWLQENNIPGIIFMEWRIPELTGPYLIQRIRKKFPAAKIVVVSDLIEAADEPLIHEMGVTEVIRKPIDREQFATRLVHAVRQEKIPTEVEILERKIRQHLAARDLVSAQKLKEQYLNESTITPIRKMKIEAEFAYFEGDYIKARNLAAESLRGSPDSVMILNLLGKTLMQLHDYAASLRCFEKAQEISPKNIQRLCAIAEATAELNQIENSNAAIGEAKGMDSGNGEIIQAEARIAVSAGDTDKAREIMGQLDALSELISYMNNKAVSLAKCGQIDQGIEIYKRTINSVPEKNSDVKAIVLYNLALAFVRMGEQGEAADTLKLAIDIGETRVLKKSKSLKARLEKAMQSGQVVTLASDTAAASDSKKATSDEIGAAKGHDTEKGNAVSDANRAVAATVTIKPGEMCCFRLYNYTDKLAPQVLAWFDKLPRFKTRHAIEREESMGVDKMMSA